MHLGCCPHVTSLGKAVKLFVYLFPPWPVDFFGTQAESHFSMSVTHSVVSEHSGHPLFGESSLPEAVASVPKMAFDPPQVHTTTHKLASFPRLSPSLRCQGTSIALSSLEPALWVFQGFGSCVCYGHITQLGTKIQASCAGWPSLFPEAAEQKRCRAPQPAHHSHFSCIFLLLVCSSFKALLFLVHQCSQDPQ